MKDLGTWRGQLIGPRQKKDLLLSRTAEGVVYRAVTVQKALGSEVVTIHHLFGALMEVRRTSPRMQQLLSLLSKYGISVPSIKGPFAWLPLLTNEPMLTDEPKFTNESTRTNEPTRLYIPREDPLANNLPALFLSLIALGIFAVAAYGGLLLLRLFLSGACTVVHCG
jgi:hypothetical protein